MDSSTDETRKTSRFQFLLCFCCLWSQGVLQAAKFICHGYIYEVDLNPKKSSQLASRFIQMVIHHLLPWFKVIALVQSRIPAKHVCAKKGWNSTYISCLVGDNYGLPWTAFMSCCMNSYWNLE